MTGAWRLALRNLSRNRWRNVATASAIAFGFAGLVMVGGYVLRIDRYLAIAGVYLGHTGHVSIYQEGGIELATVKPKRYSLSAEAQATIAEVLKQHSEVEHVGRYLNGVGLVGNGCKTVPFVAQGIDPEVDAWVRQHPRVRATLYELLRPVKGMTLGDAKSEPRPISLSTVLAQYLGKPRVKSELPPVPRAPSVIACDQAGATERIAGDPGVQLYGMAFDGSFSVVESDLVGIHTTGFAQTENSSVIVPLATLQQLYDTDKVTYMAAYLKDPSDAAAFARTLEAELHQRGLKVSVFTWNDERVNGLYVGTHAFLVVMAVFMATIILLVVVLSIVNSVTLSVLERTREIGTLRSIGFLRRDVMTLFLRESVLLTGGAVACGLTFALATCLVLNALNIRYTPPGIAGDMRLMVQPNLELCVGATLLVLALASVATAFTVRSRARMKVAELNTATSG